MKSKVKIEFSPLFEKQRRAASYEIRTAFLETLSLFLEDQENLALRNHALRGKLTGYRSIDVTSDYRAIFKQKTSGKFVIITFHLFGTHQQLYT